MPNCAVYTTCTWLGLGSGFGLGSLDDGFCLNSLILLSTFQSTPHPHPYKKLSWLSLSVLTAFSRWTWVSWCLLKQRMVEVVSGDNWSYKSCKAPVKSSPPTNQRPVFLQAGCPSHRPTNSVKALKEKYHIPWTCLPQAHLEVIQLCLWPLIAPGYLGGGLPCLSSALWCQYPQKT